MEQATMLTAKPKYLVRWSKKADKPEYILLLTRAAN